MPKATCSTEDCDRTTVARGLCMMHYQRMRGGRPLNLAESLNCASCLIEFKPKFSHQKHCSRQCGANAAVRRKLGYPNPVPRIRPCDYCGTEFERKGQGAYKYCSQECAKIMVSIRSHVRDYGMTKTQFREMFQAQGGVCGSCKRPGGDGHKKVLCVDHCHETGKVRGLLCGNCNAAIGLLGDTVEGVEAALAYLRSAS